ncbi:hypothetical protein DPX16_10864 [Anabarilius grahami]|uniref:Uncharacterized protein n=1 Tax=Anabarilius grahami TaxID=495550 RepID=A0A3N0Z7Z2_ANAGA|nr:hypothetical protein DPX16_10864 [Anabarilius grahami]
MLDAFSSGLGLRSILVQQIQEINATLEPLYSIGLPNYMQTVMPNSPADPTHIHGLKSSSSSRQHPSPILPPQQVNPHMKASETGEESQAAVS